MLWLALLLPGCAGSGPIPIEQAYPLTHHPKIEAQVRAYCAGLPDPVIVGTLTLYRPGHRAGLLCAVVTTAAGGGAGESGMPSGQAGETDETTSGGASVARGETSGGGGGRILVFGQGAGGMTWVADWDPPLAEPGILSFRPLTLPGFDGPLIEVFGVNAQGTGHYQLYHIDLPGRRLEQVLKTPAVDRNPADGQMIRGGRLGAVYYQPTVASRAGAVTLVGVIDEYDTQDPGFGAGMAAVPQPFHSRRVRKQFYWNNHQKRYLPAPDDDTTSGYEAWSW